MNQVRTEENLTPLFDTAAFYEATQKIEMIQKQNHEDSVKIQTWLRAIFTVQKQLISHRGLAAASQVNAWLRDAGIDPKTFE